MKNPISAFDQLALDPLILKALDTIGYETPSPIQAQTIPALLDGKDIIGQAQTGTGKTAAFALPALSNIDLELKAPQVLVLAPTRELAIQVAEAFREYAKFMKGFQVLPVYGGQDYRVQTRALQRGVHVVVGTPGRTMDHLRRGYISTDNLKVAILDEADEMLRMGFIEDVQWILEKTPQDRQTALFSATMPPQIRRIADQHLNEPEHITVKVKTNTADTINQRYWMVPHRDKLDALTRILEIESFDAMLIFVRTKHATSELSDKLNARGYASAPLSGDIQQKMRERTVDQLKRGTLDIIVATDVAARGLDVSRVSHVLNYDIPHDTEAYIHRIGRTGRAGRQGEAIMFVTPREKRMLRSIERAAGKSIDALKIPSNDVINQHRIDKFKQRISDALEHDNLPFYQSLIADFIRDNDTDAQNVAAALASLLQGSTPLLVPTRSESSEKNSRLRSDNSRKARSERKTGDKPQRKERPSFDNKRDKKKKHNVDVHMEQFRIEVGYDHGVEPRNIVGAIANEAEIDSQYIGSIDIKDDYTLIDLPEGMPNSIYKDLKKAWICGRQMQISRVGDRSNSNKGNAKARKGSAKRSKPKKAK